MKKSSGRNRERFRKKWNKVKTYWVKKTQTATAQLVLEKIVEEVKESGSNTVIIDEKSSLCQMKKQMSVCVNFAVNGVRKESLC